MALQGEAVLTNFWDEFLELYPTHPLQLDVLDGQTDTSLLVPLLIHGDGGRHYRKSEIMVVQCQPVLGLGTRISRKRFGDHQRRDGELNFLGHSFSTRFLMATLTKQYYAKDPQPLLQLMTKISEFFESLYTQGLRVHGKTLKFLVLGLKGDLPFISKVAQLRRSFTHTRKRKQHEHSKELAGICWLCHAGTPDVPFEDGSRTATWMETMGINNDCPWDPNAEPGILSQILHDPLRKPDFFKLDLFHILSAGVEKDYAASALVMLLPCFGESSQEKNLKSMNGWLAAFLKEQRLQLNCRQLSLTLIGADTPKSFPSGGCGVHAVYPLGNGQA